MIQKKVQRLSGQLTDSASRDSFNTLMTHSFKIGLSFGLTSGIVTTLGLLVGLYASTQSKLVVIGGILTVAIADAFSDAAGIHLSEESEAKHVPREIWVSTVATFTFKFLTAFTFVVPIILLPIERAIIVNTAWGLLLLAVFSWFLARMQNAVAWKVIGEHLILAIAVIAIANYVGSFIAMIFG